ncbi:MAG TPA: ComF family protein [Noviherbaspirillum sp.]|nr:ComF family protein [Noviherbaspirillum sp.]
MFSRLRYWSRHVLARLPTLLPSSCALCSGNAPHALCEGCRGDFFAHQPLRCAQCAIPLPNDAGITAPVCGNCLQHAPAYDATIVAADYVAPADRLILALKFGARLELAPLLADMMRDAMLSNRLLLPTHLTAVPLGPQRLVERGFNQALEIAKPLSRTLGIALDRKLIVRQRDTQSQARLPPDERRKNLRNAFLVPAEAIDFVHGRHIGVVDDVMTTGETLHEIAVTLKRFGAARVTNIVFARTPQH